MKYLKPNTPIKVLGSNAHTAGTFYSNLDIINLNPMAKKLKDSAKESLAKRIEKEYGIKNRYMNRFPGEVKESLEDEKLGEELAKESIGACFKEASENIVEFFVHGTTTPSRYTGVESTYLLNTIGQQSPYLEVKAGCSTSLASLYTGINMLRCGHKNVLINCVETMSKVLNPEVPETWFGGGDGTGTIWLEHNQENPDFEVKAMIFGSDGSLVDTYTTPGKFPPNKKDLDELNYTLKGDGTKLFAASLEAYAKMLSTIKNDFDLEKINFVIPHQVNLKLIQTLFEKYHNIPNAKLITHSDQIGNIGGSSILYSLSRAVKEEEFQKGDQILMMSVGGGLSFALQIWEKL